MAPATRKSRVLPAAELDPALSDLTVKATEFKSNDSASVVAVNPDSAQHASVVIPESEKHQVTTDPVPAPCSPVALTVVDSPSKPNAPVNKGKSRALADRPPTPFPALRLECGSPSPAPRARIIRPILELSEDSDKENAPPSEEFMRAKARANRDALYAEGRRSLGEAVEGTRQAGRSRRAASALSTGSINPFLVPTNNGVGSPVLDRAMNDLENSMKALRLGNPHTIEENCHWVQDGFKPTFTLRDKEDAVVQPEGFEPNAPAVIGWLGRVVSDGSIMSPDAGYNPNFEATNNPNRKWIVAVNQPSPEMRLPTAFYAAQMSGARSFVDNGRRSLDGQGLVDVGHSFFDSGIGGLRVRSPVFLPYHIPVLGSDDENDQAMTAEKEAGIPAEYRFATWRFASAAVKTAFKEVIEKGFEPQQLEVYDVRDRHIHINNAQGTLANSLVCVYCTMEKALFRGRAQPNGRAWQFYVNLVKVQVLKQPSAIPPVPRKRPMIKGYTADDEHERSAQKTRLV
ncbi:unnamed protein product [Rhizoctonia solani]|uniref:Uncharacterized protein n=1 Tax=Rhizoctonia solani TaxID=456999 RepID=A0A8H3CPE9_9AGAM|nr:unnamed protein product [Rhizoctonia solani]